MAIPSPLTYGLDLNILAASRADIIAENKLVEAPDLVVEILSEATKTTDRTSEKTLYAPDTEPVNTGLLIQCPKLSSNLSCGKEDLS